MYMVITQIMLKVPNINEIIFNCKHYNKSNVF